MTERQAANLIRAREVLSEIRGSRIEDYLHIGGPRLPARVAAQRVGVTKRTIERYRSELRQKGIQ